MTRINAYGSDKLNEAFKKLFDNTLFELLKSRTKESFDTYLKFIETGTGLSDYDLKKHNEAEKFRNEDLRKRRLDFYDYFVKTLLQWFKKEFYTWCDKPLCSTNECKSKGLKGDYLETTAPNSEEEIGQASRTEVYQCPECKKHIRFPRFNNCINLIESRTGRCGEWANLFGAILVYFGYETRFVDNFEDHVWNEYYSKHQKRWIHLDPCESAYDTPLVYEQGWGRNMTFIIAYCKSGIYDVTRRYVKDFKLIEERRSSINIKTVEQILDKNTQILRSNIELNLVEALIKRDEIETFELINKSFIDNQLDNIENYKERESGSVD